MIRRYLPLALFLTVATAALAQIGPLPGTGPQLFSLNSCATSTGGTITTAAGTRIHRFTVVGANTLVLSGNCTVNYLVAGGGGTGGPGNGTNTGGGGGSGGGVQTGTMDLLIGSYSVTVGNNGALSRFVGSSTITAGAGANAGTPTHGTAPAGGGDGGDGGTQFVLATGGNNGTTSSITGAPLVYGSGGGGGAGGAGGAGGSGGSGGGTGGNVGSGGGPAVANRGGGGGGSSFNGAGPSVGATGVVIISYNL